MNKSEKAIKALQELNTKLSSISNVLQGNSWKATLKDTLDLYLGPNSSISTRLNELYFTTRTLNDADENIIHNERHIYDETKKETFRGLILIAIDYIKSNGIYKNPNKKNFLSDLTNFEMLSILLIFIPLLFIIASKLVDQSKEREITNLNNTIQSKDEEINRLLNVQSDEVKHLDIENKNLWDTYLKIKQENELLKSKIK